MFQLHPTLASEWVNLSPANKQLLTSVGGFPVNDVFHPYISNDFQLRLLFGSYGSGKSVFEAQDLVNECLNSPYFKCYFGRKVFDTIRGSIFETIVDTIKDMGLDRYFKYSTAPTSTMVIECKNGNKFYPFGSDKAEKLKSIKDPTHILCEEFDQFEEEDFQMLLPRLRTTKGDNKFIGMFNTAAVFPDHWILKYFFPELYTGDDKAQFEILEGMEIQRIFANYTDNYFIDQEDYYRKLKMASGGNAQLLEAIARGAWGITENKNPWLYAFDDNKHIRDAIKFLPQYPVYLSFDFNNDPFTCVAVQMSPHKGANDSFIHFIKEFAGSFKVEDMCMRIKSAFPQSILYITGDRSGQNEDIGRNQTLYQIIAGYLGVNDKLLNLNNSNLEHADSRIMINAMLSNYPNIYFSREGCPELIRDCQKATTDPDSKKPSQLLKDRGQYKMDLFDGQRYFFQTYFHVWAKDNYLRARKK